MRLWSSFIAARFDHYLDFCSATFSFSFSFFQVTIFMFFLLLVSLGDDTAARTDIENGQAQREKLLNPRTKPEC